MATLIFGAIGQALGGPLGGAIGALIGRQADSTLFGSTRRGPRLRELEVTLSSYGTAIPRIHGRMRVPGAVIWATELQEQTEGQGGGKGQPATTTYSYAANFAVALSSRPILGIGRIWADGKLLRGAAGDLKVGGTLRIHLGGETQDPDPLIAASEGPDRCPAFRGLAYVVFEALELADFGNRLPALTFEVIGDEQVSLAAIVGETLPGTMASGTIESLSGFAVEDDLGSGLATLAPAFPLAIDAGGETIQVRLADATGEATLLGEAALPGEDDSFGAGSGTSRRRAPPAPAPGTALRYLDLDRDYLPGTQHAAGQARPGEPETIELPAAMTAGSARALVDRVSRQRDRAREQVAWRTCSLDTAVDPGARVRLPDRAGTWQVASWEWREAGVELELTRVRATAPLTADPTAAEPFPAPADTPAAQTRLVALELPWDGASPAPRRVAAVGADGPSWNGAALYAEDGAGQLQPLGVSARTRSVVGVTLAALGSASPLLIDRHSQLTIALASPDQGLTDASLAQLAGGANLALVGDELLQFARALPLGDGQWRVSHLLRGRGGTELAIPSHQTGEPFALLDGTATMIAATGAAGSAITAIGRGVIEPVTTALRLAGIGQRPLAPVHARGVRDDAGGFRLLWTRRARGPWSWSDGVDVPLVEEAERYVVSFEHEEARLRTWTVTAPALHLSAGELADTLALQPLGRFTVRQQGTFALSHPAWVSFPS